MCPAVMLSIAEVISTFQLSWLPRTVTIAVAVAVVVTGVGASFAPFSVAVKTSKPAGIPVVLSLQATPISEIVPNIASARDTRIPNPPLTAIQVKPHKASEPDTGLLSDG